ncbi:interleukin-1 receptor-associated kinase 4-like [Periplaneta americana]|uniref:interleukin-1 receptor-associated kinase 4-like n=1 Tax=Periplaneta americana TaxID=6978 RepID=UPI0037E7F006
MEGRTEIRKLPPGAVFGLVRILEIGEAWKQLMAIVPQSDTEPSDTLVLKYKVEHIKLIEQAGEKQKRPCTEIFLEEWGTSGKKRPNLMLLTQLLGKAQLFRAADYVTNLLKVPDLERPASGPAAPVDVSEEAIEKLVAKLPVEVKINQYDTDEINRAFDEMTVPDTSLPSLDGPHVVPRESVTVPESIGPTEQETLPLDQLDEPVRNSFSSLDTTLSHIPYAELEYITDHFNEMPYPENGGRKLGTGAFGTVYLGIFPSQKQVAVKRLHQDAANVETQFRNEIETLYRFKHENLLALLGYSCDSSIYCLVYEFMSNGSLQDRLACKNHQTALHWKTRFNIALGTAHGIVYLHTAYEKPLIHRDIKSANILLDEHLVPKLGDFGLVRLGQQHGNTLTMTTTVLGTSAYMAPEAFRGDVSIKLDTFSYGVVLLEILTGLPPYDEKREGHDLVTHVEAMCEEDGCISVLLDKQAGDWGRSRSNENTQVYNLADSLYSVALNCIEDNRQRRPNMAVVVKALEEIDGYVT